MTIKSAFSHTHNQTSASNQWTIEHGLNCKPSVSVAVMYQGQEQTIIPNQISYPDNNTVVVSFTQPYTGTARLF